MKKNAADPEMLFPRATTQREAITRAFESARAALSPQEVLKWATRFTPKLGIATVYRTINALVEQGWLVEVKLPGEPSRYEVSGKGHHHHFQCRGCDTVFEIHSCPKDLKSLVPSGFRLEEHHLFLYGRCAHCR